ncbi:MAG TPA: hypothetical protein VGM54_13305 [Chthoniobacter sp.]|jgi:hypothetical protein
MAVILAMTYQKKLGLPNFSSHSCSVSVTVEIPDVSVAALESSKLYALLQTAVDAEIKEVGYMPDASSYGMRTDFGSNGANGNGSNGHQSNGSSRNGEGWKCSEGQKGFILRIVNESNLDKNDVENLAQQLFGIGVKELDKMQASQLIEELLEKTGKGKGQRRQWSRRQPARV